MVVLDKVKDLESSLRRFGYQTEFVKNSLRILTSSGYTVVYYPHSDSWLYRGRVFYGTQDELISWLRKN